MFTKAQGCQGCKAGCCRGSRLSVLSDARLAEVCGSTYHVGLYAHSRTPACSKLGLREKRETETNYTFYFSWSLRPAEVDSEG